MRSPPIIPAVLLENHGPVVAGAPLDAAVFAIEELEEAAKLAIILRGMKVRHLSAGSDRRPQQDLQAEVSMPKFSANLGFMWPDRPLLERIDAAAKARLQGDRTALALRHAGRGGQAALRQAQACPAWHQHAARQCRKGDFGLGAQAGREAEFRETFQQSADYARAAGASSVHVMAGVVAPEHKARAKRGLHREPPSSRRRAAPDLDAAARADQPARQAGLFLFHHRRGGGHHRGRSARPT